MTMDARDFLVQRAVASEIPRVRPGASSFFTKPTQGLDPALFGPDNRLHTHVREWLLSTLSGYWSHRFHVGARWATIWIAGSGITYQWSAARNPGDLDILIGVDFDSFRQNNPRYQGFSDLDIGTMMNEAFKAELWPLTAATHFGDATYEVTWYVNPNSADIRFIHPYAAYNVSEAEWTVHPPELGANWDPDRDFPREWWDQIHREQAQAREVLQAYTGMVKYLKLTTNPGVRANYHAQLEQAVKRGAELFRSIHNERRNAFSPEGKGYSDWYNFRWQAHKRNGVVPALHALAELEAAARDDKQSALYGHVLTDSDTALRTAATVHSILDAVRA